MEEKSSLLKKCASLSNLIQNNQSASINIASTQGSPAQREHLSLSLLTPRTRRFSCSSNGNGTANNSSSTNNNSGLISPGPPRLAPRVSQLRLEECSDSQNVNVREANHEREVHSALSMSQSYEDLTLVMNENWSFKNNEEFSNPLHVSLPSSNACSSPSPTSRQNVMRLCAGMSPSPTRRTFATRRSMSPIAMRPSPLGSVKRKFDMIDDGNSCSSSASSQPYKKFFTESFSRGSSPLPICPSPDSSTNSETFSGRVTPKILQKFSSMTSSPLSMHSFDNDSPSPSSANQPSSSTTSSSSSTSSLAQSSQKEQERMETASTISGDSGVSDVQSDSTLNSDSAKEREEMVIEEEVTPSNIPMTL